MFRGIERQTISKTNEYYKNFILIIKNIKKYVGRISMLIVFSNFN